MSVSLLAQALNSEDLLSCWHYDVGASDDNNGNRPPLHLPFLRLPNKTRWRQSHHSHSQRHCTQRMPSTSGIKDECAIKLSTTWPKFSFLAFLAVLQFSSLLRTSKPATRREVDEHMYLQRYILFNCMRTCLPKRVLDEVLLFPRGFVSSTIVAKTKATGLSNNRSILTLDFDIYTGSEPAHLVCVLARFRKRIVTVEQAS